MFDDLRRRYVDPGPARLGSEVVYATDDFFADKARLISPEPPVFVPQVRRERQVDGRLGKPPQAHARPRLVRDQAGVPGEIAGFEIDTSHFTGNYPPGAEIEVCAPTPISRATTPAGSG